MGSDFWHSSQHMEWMNDVSTSWARSASGHQRQSTSSSPGNSNAGDDPSTPSLSEREVKVILMHYIQCLRRWGERMNLGCRVLGTACVYVKRFYLLNDLLDCDPLLIVPSALLLASKIEESRVNLKMIMKAGPKDFPYSPQDIIECECLLMSELRFYLTVYHAYKPLKQFTKDCQLQHPEFLQTAWNIVNDSYYSDVCLQYPPYMIALAAIYMTAVFEKDNRDIVIGDTATTETGINVENPSTHGQTVNVEQHVRNWFYNLNVQMKPIGHITSQLLDMYKNVASLQEDVKELLTGLKDWRQKVLESQPQHARLPLQYSSPIPPHPVSQQPSHHQKAYQSHQQHQRHHQSRQHM